MEGVAFQAIILQHIGAEDHMKLQFTDRNFVDNFLKVVIYLALVANI